MTTCPKGHASASTDYCDECGTPINAAPTAAPSTTAAGPAEAPAPTQPCPDCGTPRTDRFCEVCGYDHLAVPATPTTPSTPGTAEAAEQQAVAWQVVATADRAYYDRMCAAAGPDAPQVPFPAYCPQRRFALTGAEVLIGRRSRSRGIEPVIDLSGPPQDAAVSHAHALLVATPDGWSVVDLDSANGTYLNDATDQLDANVAVALQPGDQFHIGGWTTLTIVA